MTARQSRRYAQALSLLWPVPAVLLVSLAVVALPAGSMLRLLLTGIVLLFLPGYALTFAVFPESRPQTNDTEMPLSRRIRERTLSSLDSVERIALGFGFSVALMPIYGFVVGVVPSFVYDAQTVVVLVSAATVLATVLAGVRYATSSGELVVPSPFAQLAREVNAQTAAVTPRGRILNVAVVVALVLVSANLAVAIALPADGAEYTTAMLLSENENGELVTGGYPEELQSGESAVLVLRVENHEAEEVDYTVVVQQQRVNEQGDVTETARLNQFSQNLTPTQAWELKHDVTSQMSGERTRLAYLIYTDEVPPEPTLNNSYRNLTLWVGTEQTGGNTAVDESVTENGAPVDGTATGDQTSASVAADRFTAPSLVAQSGNGALAAVSTALTANVHGTEIICPITNTGTDDTRCN